MQNIKNDAENKLLILHTLQNTKFPLTKYDLSMIMLDNLLMTYFTFNESINDLLESKFVSYDKEFVDLTEQGRNVLKLFSDSIDEYKKGIIESYIKKIRNDVIENNSIVANYKAIDTNKFELLFEIKEKNEVIFSSKLVVPEEEMAKSFVENFKKNHNEVYRRFFTII